MKADAIVRARIPKEMKEKATKTLEQMGLSMSDLIRLTCLRVAEEGRLPFDITIPHQRIHKVISERK
ncbi:type II toxin-antitoxin system RelB/DinJ family antitoxin [Bartonella sp. C271]|uniref:type II toxin-antitoxin system RelB/DinJ family antitoxin n=1 Tax=Bartonella sp. C271 TaxID=3070220 RepID=UPI0038B54F9C